MKVKIDITDKSIHFVAETWEENELLSSLKAGTYWHVSCTRQSSHVPGSLVLSQVELAALREEK